MRECEEKLRNVQLSKALQLDLATGSRLASHQRGTRVKHAEELKTHASCCTIRQKS